MLPRLVLDPAVSNHLGLTQAMETLRALCANELGREHLAQTPFPDTLAEVDERLSEAMEARGALERRVSPPFGEVHDIRPHLAAVNKGVVLGAPDLVEVGRSLDALSRLRDVLVFQGALAPLLEARGSLLGDERRFARRVLGAFDETGLLRDDASHALSLARARVRQLRDEASVQLERVVRDLDEAGHLQERNFTIRNDRYVVPVRASNQGLVEGIVHDASQTHQTVFVEPRAVLEIGNRLKIAKLSVSQEEERVLTQLSAELAERTSGIEADLRLCGALDALFARGQFARLTQGEKPRLVLGSDTLVLRNARHPLLAFLRASDPQAAPLVENDIILGKDGATDSSSGDGARVLVISGPNGGGKTVALTTAGLIALLARAGVPVPVAPDSVIPCFATVACAMAGDQNLQAGLSTFQMHLVELKRALDTVEAANGPALCLIDEICSGTDPNEGAALAQALLERLATRARVLCTTHFERLKVLAFDPKQQGLFRNASFALADVSGQPTFRLVLDQVGTSRALTAARIKGLPEAVMQRAESLLSPDDKELASALRVLGEQKDALRARLDAVEDERATLAAERQELVHKLDKVEREAHRLRAEGKRAFLDELREARRIVADAIEAAKAKASAAALDKANHALMALEAETRESLSPKAQHAAQAPKAVAVGDAVYLDDLPGNRFTVVEVDGDALVVASGPLKRRTTLAHVRRPSDEAASGRRKKASGTRRASVAPATVRGAEPKTADNSLDVRGQRQDEALANVDGFLDRMMKDDRGRAFILHGHGAGALKAAIRKALAASRYVERVQPSDPEDGGDAWTTVTLTDR